jgi:hypothetical protein
MALLGGIVLGLIIALLVVGFYGDKLLDMLNNGGWR